MFVDSCLSLFWNTSLMLCAKEKTQQTSQNDFNLNFVLKYNIKSDGSKDPGGTK